MGRHRQLRPDGAGHGQIVDHITSSPTTRTKAPTGSSATKPTSEHEAYTNQRITEAGIPKQVFLTRKGDVFIWHANLMHGGEPHHEPAPTRKSMVFHHFSQAHICYHEITQRPARRWRLNQ